MDRRLGDVHNRSNRATQNVHSLRRTWFSYLLPGTWYFDILQRTYSSTFLSQNQVKTAVFSTSVRAITELINSRVQQHLVYIPTYVQQYIPESKAGQNRCTVVLSLIHI